MLFTGPVKPQMREIEDLKLYELTAAVILIAAIVLLGLWPTPLIDLSVATITQMNDFISQSIQ
jgi:NADH-quinone oxidoreductase subunit M